MCYTKISKKEETNKCTINWETSIKKTRRQFTRIPLKVKKKSSFVKGNESLSQIGIRCFSP